jgi:hypothetical protein
MGHQVTTLAESQSIVIARRRLESLTSSGRLPVLLLAPLELATATGGWLSVLLVVAIELLVGGRSSVLLLAGLSVIAVCYSWLIGRIKRRRSLESLTSFRFLGSFPYTFVLLFFGCSLSTSSPSSSFVAFELSATGWLLIAVAYRLLDGYSRGRRRSDSLTGLGSSTSFCFPLAFSLMVSTPAVCCYWPLVDQVSDKRKVEALTGRLLPAVVFWLLDPYVWGRATGENFESLGSTAIGLAAAAACSHGTDGVCCCYWPLVEQIRGRRRLEIYRCKFATSKLLVVRKMEQRQKKVKKSYGAIWTFNNSPCCSSLFIFS